MYDVQKRIKKQNGRDTNSRFRSAFIATGALESLFVDSFDHLDEGIDFTLY